MDRQASWVAGATSLATQQCCCYALGRNDFGQSGVVNADNSDVVVPARAIEGLGNAKVVCVAGTAGHSAFVTGIASARLHSEFHITNLGLYRTPIERGG
jgi:hypothetical protein